MHPNDCMRTMTVLKKNLYQIYFCFQAPSISLMGAIMAEEIQLHKLKEAEEALVECRRALAVASARSQGAKTITSAAVAREQFRRGLVSYSLNSHPITHCSTL